MKVLQVGKDHNNLPQQQPSKSIMRKESTRNLEKFGLNNYDSIFLIIQFCTYKFKYSIFNYKYDLPRQSRVLMQAIWAS